MSRGLIKSTETRARLNGVSNSDSLKEDKCPVIRVVTDLSRLTRFPLSLPRDALKLVSGDEWKHYQSVGLGAVPVLTNDFTSPRNQAFDCRPKYYMSLRFTPF